MDIHDVEELAPTVPKPPPAPLPTPTLEPSAEARVVAKPAVAEASAGRGRGAGINRPAWMDGDSASTVPKQSLPGEQAAAAAA